MIEMLKKIVKDNIGNTMDWDKIDLHFGEVVGKWDGERFVGEDGESLDVQIGDITNVTWAGVDLGNRQAPPGTGFDESIDESIDESDDESDDEAPGSDEESPRW